MCWQWKMIKCYAVLVCIQCLLLCILFRWCKMFRLPKITMLACIDRIILRIYFAQIYIEIKWIIHILYAWCASPVCAFRNFRGDEPHNSRNKNYLIIAWLRKWSTSQLLRFGSFTHRTNTICCCISSVQMKHHWIQIGPDNWRLSAHFSVLCCIVGGCCCCCCSFFRHACIADYFIRQKLILKNLPIFNGILILTNKHDESFQCTVSRI